MMSLLEKYTPLTNIINGLKTLGKFYKNDDLVTKILRSLSKLWEPKVIAILEAKDLKTLPLNQLLGSFMTYEIMLREDHNNKKKGIAPIATTETEEVKDEDIVVVLR